MLRDIYTSGRKVDCAWWILDRFGSGWYGECGQQRLSSVRRRELNECMELDQCIKPSPPAVILPYSREKGSFDFDCSVVHAWLVAPPHFS